MKTNQLSKPFVLAGPLPTQLAHLFNQALSAFQTGDWALAERECWSILQLKDNDFDALTLMGVMAAQTQRMPMAADLFFRAVTTQPHNFLAHFYLGNALFELNRWQESVKSYDKAIGLKADFAEAHSNRANGLQKLQLWSAAVAGYEVAISIRSDYVDAYINLGNVLRVLERWDHSIACCFKAISIVPDFAPAYSNLGLARMGLKKLEEALYDFERAIQLHPDYPDAHSNRGVALTELKQWEESLQSANRAICLKPDFFEAYSNRGNTLKYLNRHQEAMDSYERAIVIHPHYSEAYSNFADTLQDLKQFDRALNYYDKAIELNAQFSEAYLNKSLALLLLGQFSQAWPLYEYRWHSKRAQLQSRHFTQPRWTRKQGLVGKTILLHSEQGLGDTIQFCRYAKVLSDLGAKVILEAPRTLMSVLQGIEGVHQWVEEGAILPFFDFYCPLLSLPMALNTTISNIPAPPQYLQAPQNKLKYWQQKLGPRTKPRIGLVWRGNAGHQNDHNRSMALSLMMNSLEAQCDYYSLQQTIIEADRAVLENSKIHYWKNELTDFGDTSAICELMDLVIGVDTSVVHLSAAMGKQTWTLLPCLPDWRWLLDTKKSVWYPTMTLYRQAKLGDWSDAMEQVKRDLLVVSQNG